MKIKSGFPSLSLKINKVVLPGQDTDSSIDITTGPVSFEIEGDAKELVLYGTTIMSELKSAVEFIRECIEEEEAKREAKYHHIQNEIDTEVSAQMHVHEMNFINKSNEYRDQIQRLLDTNTTLEDKIINLERVIVQCNYDVSLQKG